MDRRQFVKGAMSLSATGAMPAAGSLYAAGRERMRVGLIGCGGRGRDALQNFHQAAQHCGIEAETKALADLFGNHTLDTAREFKVPPDRCTHGPDAYKKVLASDIDVVLLATPPVFRPVHFEAAIKAGKHVFMEKPAAVDAPGTRSILQTGQLARNKNLTVVAGTQRRYEKLYLQTYAALRQNAIGSIRSGQIWWCQHAQRRFERQPGWDATAYMARNWMNFVEMSGDHIVEQHIHNIDIANWFVGRPPVSAIGFGGRTRRKTGNQYDFFSVDYDYGQDVHIHSMCRQIDGCYERTAEHFVGTDGVTWGTGPGRKGFSRKVEIPELLHLLPNPYVQEHVALIRSVIDGQGHNDTETLAFSTLTAIMGRISAYTGQLVRFRELMDETIGSRWYHFAMRPGPLDFENSTVDIPDEDNAPLPGRAVIK